MQDLIKRYFWVVGALTVMICAIFGAKAFGHIMEAKFLGDSDKPPKITPVAPRPDAPVKKERTKDGGPFAARNMFCSECTPAPVVNADPSSIQITTLPLSLVVTNVNDKDDKQSYAIVVNTESQRQGSYSVGDQLPGSSGKVKAIRYKYVDFENNGRIERVMLVGAAPVTTPTPVASADPGAGSGSGDDLQAALDTGIKKIDDTTFEIDKALVDRVTANPMEFMKGARVVPAMKNGKPEGIKLYAIRPNSPYAKLGLTNGDTLMSINNLELNSVDKGLEIYGKLRDSTSLQLEVVRRGKPVTLKYTIR
ncbi:MAG TPA: type II secretion system protein GspC [Kofleriaceae bacterium]|nr:type II secretion system protein GspC [Kofleriaceae bacterium]